MAVGCKTVESRDPAVGELLSFAELGVEPAEQVVAIDAQAGVGTGLPLQAQVQEDAGVKGLVPGEGSVAAISSARYWAKSSRPG